MFFAFLFDIKTILKLLNIIDRNWSKKQIYLKAKAMFNVRSSDYVKSNQWICMKFLPEVRPGQRHNLLNFGDDRDYDSDPGSGL